MDIKGIKFLTYIPVKRSRSRRAIRDRGSRDGRSPVPLPDRGAIRPPDTPQVDSSIFTIRTKPESNTDSLEASHRGSIAKAAFTVASHRQAIVFDRSLYYGIIAPPDWHSESPFPERSSWCSGIDLVAKDIKLPEFCNNFQ